MHVPNTQARCTAEENHDEALRSAELLRDRLAKLESIVSAHPSEIKAAVAKATADAARHTGEALKDANETHRAALDAAVAAAWQVRWE